MRFANRVPLLFQQGACVTSKAIQSVNWKPYGLNQSRGSSPVGPLTIVIHISSVWVPFTSESKEAIAPYNEIFDEMKLALQEVGRQLATYTAKKARVGRELKKRSFIKKYLSHVAIGLKEILGFDKADEEVLMRRLEDLLEEKRGKVDAMDFDPTKNQEYDDEWAKIGKDSSKNSSSEEESNDAVEDNKKTKDQKKVSSSKSKKSTQTTLNEGAN